VHQLVNATDQLPDNVDLMCLASLSSADRRKLNVAFNGKNNDITYNTVKQVAFVNDIAAAKKRKYDIGVADEAMVNSVKLIITGQYFNHRDCSSIHGYYMWKKGDGGK
jgi:hypothetical protein